MNRNRIHIVAAAPGELSAAEYHELATAVGTTDYDVRLKLHATLPRSLAAFETTEHALQAAEIASRIGLRCVVFSETSMPPGPVFAVHGWQWNGDELCATNRAGEVLTVKAEAWSSMVFGRRNVVRHESEVDSEVMTGSGWSQETVFFVTDKSTRDMTFFALLLPVDLAAPAVLFAEKSIDLACLPAKKVFARAAAMSLLRDMLITNYPALHVDQTLVDKRVNSDQHRCFRDGAGIDASLAVAYVLDLLRRAKCNPRRYFSLLGPE